MCLTIHRDCGYKTRQDGHGEVASGNCLLNKPLNSDTGDLELTLYETPFLKLTTLPLFPPHPNSKNLTYL